MRRTPIAWTLVAPLLVAAAVTGTAVGTWAERAVRNFHLRQTEERLRVENRFLQTLLQSDRFDAFDERAAAELARLARAISPDTRVTVIAASGRVLADSAAAASRMMLRHGRPEVAAALEGREGRDVRHSDTTGLPTVYLALPLRRGEAVVGALRTAVAVDRMEAAIAALRRRMLAATAGAAALVAAVALLLAARILRPMAAMTDAARRFAAGRLDHRVAPPPIREIAEVAEAMNQMASELDVRMRALETQQREVETLLQSLSEGVLAIDAQERLLFANGRAAELLAAGTQWRRGQDLRACVRVVPFQELLLSALRERRTAETSATIRDGESERFVHGRAAPLQDADGRVRGAVMVFNDLTNLHRLMTLRREFVANVSHELKTPLTSIRGFLETVLDPRPPSAEEQRRFLGIALRQTQRLQTLVDDLLQLSRVEQMAEAVTLRVAEVSAADITTDAVEVCGQLAAERSVSLRADVPPDVLLRADPDLLGRALVNLLDNAIKHSPPGEEVLVQCGLVGGRVRWRVVDHGPGIEARHLPRLFERFYRVDKSRSRREGGTGLGLAIVKHIVAAHGGEVGVESEPGRGSRFWFAVPQNGPVAGNGHGRAAANRKQTPC